MVEKRDTEDRRKLRGLPKLTVALELLVALGEWNAELLRGLEASLSSGVETEGKEEEGEEGDNGAFDITRLAELFARSAPGAFACIYVCVFVCSVVFGKCVGGVGVDGRSPSIYTRTRT